MLWRKLVPVFAMGALGIGYVLARPMLAQSVEHLAIYEFPLGAAIVGGLVWAALRRGERPVPPPPWRRHEQVVRTLPDPAMRPYVGALERWVETGEGPELAASVLARAMSTDAREQERLRERLVPELSSQASRRKRRTLLNDHLEGA